MSDRSPTITSATTIKKLINIIDDESSSDISISRNSNNNRKTFDLKAFSEMKQDDPLTKSDEVYAEPVNVAILKDDESMKGKDDGVIKRIFKSPFPDTQSSSQTMPTRRPDQKYYYCPSNTIVASNGGVYHVEPYMLPPPQEISAMIREISSSDHRSKLNKHQQQSDKQSNNRHGSRHTSPQHSNVENSSNSNNHHFQYDKFNSPKNGSSSDRSGTGGSLKHRNGFMLESLKEGNDEHNNNKNNNNGNNTVGGGRKLYKALSHIDTSVGMNDHQYNNNNNNNNAMTQYGSYTGRSDVSSDSTSSGQDTPRGGETYFRMKDFSFYKYIKAEMLGTGSQLHQLDSDAFEKISNFLNVPIMVEKVISYGVFVCFDAFLYVITYLPIRVGIAVFYLLWDSLFSNVKTVVIGGGSSSNSNTGGDNSGTSASSSSEFLKFRRVYAFDILRGILLIIGSSVLRLLHMSRVYHYIRGQTIIKLYVLTSMLEVLDRLFGSFGQDLFESLHVQTKNNNHPLSFSVLITFFVTTVYVIIHSSIYFIHIATLLVTINSAEQALLAVLFLNNFSEIRSFVFKKFDRISVMQLSFADTTERFQLMLFLILITIVSYAQTGATSLYSNLSIIVCMLLGESLGDWIKHAFISKFNSLDSSVYSDMTRVLRSDIIRSFKEKMSYDHNYAVTRRVGLSQIPLGCVTVRYILLALDSPAIKSYFESLSPISKFSKYFTFFIVLVIIKMIVGVTLIFLSGWIHNQDLKSKFINFQNISVAKRTEQRELMLQLSNIERYTLYKGRVLG